MDPLPFDKAIVNSIKDHLIDKGETIAVAESATAGLLQFALASADNAIHFFQGGITAYNLGQKTRHLGIDPIYAQSCNCVSDKIAERLAAGACGLFSSNWGIGITGYASPVPESGNKVFAFYAIAHDGKIVAANKIDPDKDDVFAVQARYVRAVLASLQRYLQEKGNNKQP